MPCRLKFLFSTKARHPFRIIFSALLETCFPSTLLIRHTHKIGNAETADNCGVKTDRTNSGTHPTAANRIKPKRRFSLKLTNSVKESNDKLELDEFPKVIIKVTLDAQIPLLIQSENQRGQ